MLPKFEPESYFYATRKLLVSGVIFDRGDLFDKSLVSNYKLLLMYQSRHICYEYQLSPHLIEKLTAPKVENTLANTENKNDTVKEEKNNNDPMELKTKKNAKATKAPSYKDLISKAGSDAGSENLKDEDIKQLLDIPDIENNTE